MSQDFSSIPFPCFKTERLKLRQTTYEDAEAVFTVFSDPKVTKFHNLDTFTHLDQANRVIARRIKDFSTGRGIRWGIIHQKYNYLIGSCGFTWNNSENGAEVGYELKSQFWQQGIMTEALSAIVQYGFASRNLHFVVAQIMLANVASRKLLEKLGFQSQGIIKKQGFWKGEYHDLEQFILFNDNPSKN